MTTGPLGRLRAICLALPEVTKKLNHGMPSWVALDREPDWGPRDLDHGQGLPARGTQAAGGATDTNTVLDER
jgi:hypothetical protein